MCDRVPSMPAKIIQVRLAGWVAHIVLVGNGPEALGKMLGLYDRNSEWDLSVCTVPTKGYDPCPDYAKRRRDFPRPCGSTSPRTATLSTPAPPRRAPSLSHGVAKSTEEPGACRLSSGTGFFVAADGAPSHERPRRRGLLGHPCDVGPGGDGGREARRARRLQRPGSPANRNG